MAPPGHSTFYALAPVPHLGKLPIDWDARSGPILETRILDEIERRLIPDIKLAHQGQILLHADRLRA